MTILTTDFLPDPAVQTAADPAAVIVVPCYNEARRLSPAAFLAHAEAEPAVSFLFVDDGSSDDTLARLTALQAARPGQIAVLALSRNAGKAEAVRQGLRHAAAGGAAFVGYWDADLATPLNAIGDFLRIGRRLPEVEVIFGSRRMMLGHRIDRSFRRRMVSRLCAALARQAVRLPVADTQCGAKLMRNTPALRRAVAQPFTAGWLFDVELFARISARHGNARRAFFEMPLAEWDEVAGSKVTGGAIARSGLRMLRLIAETRLGLPARAPLAAPPVARAVLPAAIAAVAAPANTAAAPGAARLAA